MLRVTGCSLSSHGSPWAVYIQFNRRQRAGVRRLGVECSVIERGRLWKRVKKERLWVRAKECLRCESESESESGSGSDVVIDVRNGWRQ